MVITILRVRGLSQPEIISVTVPGPTAGLTGPQDYEDALAALRNSYAGSQLSYDIRADGNTSSPCDWTTMPTTSGGAPEVLALAPGVFLDIYFILNVPITAQTGAYTSTLFVISAKS